MVPTVPLVDFRPGAMIPAMSAPDVPPPFSQPERREEERNWTPIVVGLVLVILVVAGIAILGRNRQTTTTEVHPYAANLKMGDIKLSAADNFVGGTVTYLDFALTNAGTQTLVGGQVEVKFKNAMGQVVQTEVLPLRAVVPNQLGGYPDLVELASSPIGPGQTKTIRLSLEHVSSDWDQSYPDLKFINLKLK